MRVCGNEDCCKFMEEYSDNCGMGLVDGCSEYFEIIAETKTYDTYYETLSIFVGKLVDEKQAAYGNSFGKAGKFLELLYPDGILPDQYGDALTLVRIFDKQMRIATDKDAFGESPYQDIAGYGLLGLGKDNINTKPSED